MDISTLKIQFIEEFLKVKDDRLILKLSTILHAEQKDGSEYKLSKDELYAVEEGIEELEKGNSYSHKQVMDEMKHKYPDLFK